MAAHAHALCTGPVVGAAPIGGSTRCLCTLQGDGVSCYDTRTQKPVLSWALGSSDQEFSGSAVYDYGSNLCFAPVRPRSGGGAAAARSASVLAWSADAGAGTITQLAHALHLPPLHRLFPLSKAPEGEAEEAAAAAAEEAMAVDGSGAKPAGAVAVLADGGVALCAGDEIVAEAEGARGQHTVAAAYQPAAGRLVVVSAAPRAAALGAAVYRVQGGELQSEATFELEPPAAGCRAVAATSTPERTAVLWSDGTLAVYAVPGDALPALPLPTGSSRAPVAKRRLAGFGAPAAKQQKSSGGSKKRGAAGEAEAAAGSACMAAIEDKQVAVVAWATSCEGAPVLRVVVLETGAACVQLAQDFAAADVGLAALDPAKPVQAESLGGNQLAVSIGSAVLVVSLTDLQLPTLANLLGALSIGKAQLAVASGSAAAASAGTSGAALLAPSGGALLGASAVVNPAALAAARVLHADELAELAAPFGSAPRPIELSIKLEAPAHPGQWLVPASELVWRVRDEAADARVAAEERRVWQEVQQQPAAAALGSDAGMQRLLKPLLDLRRSTGLALSPALVAGLLMAAAERQHWGAAAAIAAAQPPCMLGDVPGLAAAAAAAGQMDLVERLLLSAQDVPAAELAALLGVLLSPASSDAASAGRKARHVAAQAAADAAAAAAAKAARQAAVAGPAAAATQQQQQDEQAAGAATASRRRRRKKGASGGGDDDSDNDADLTALTPAASEPGAENGTQHAAAAAAAAPVPALAAYERPGARQQAVAACCRAAVDGLDAADSCLHPALAARHLPAVLLDALRGLSAQQAVALLRYLAALLRNHARHVGCAAAGWVPPLALPASVVLPPLRNVVDWAGATIDAHLVRLSLEPEARPVLAELSALVEGAVEEARPLLRLGGIVSHLVSQHAVPRAALSAADYSVQWLDLRVAPAEQQQHQQRGVAQQQ